MFYCYLEQFEKFRNRIVETNGLCPNHWNAELSMTTVLLQPKRNFDVSNILKRYSKVNNKYLTSYDSKELTKNTTYLDKNNLYTYALPKFLQTGKFKWLDLTELNLNKCDDSSSRGFVLEVIRITQILQ